MGFFDWLSKWSERRKKKKEEIAIAQIDSLLEGEGNEIIKLRSILAKIRVELDESKKAAFYIQFEKELSKFEEYAGIIENLDKSKLSGTIFKNLKKNMDKRN